MKVPISAIKGLDTYRKNPGDLTKLAESIKESGLLRPVILTKDDELVSGSRRVRAAMLNGSTVIDAVVPEDLRTLMSLLRDEEHDLPFTPMERVRFWQRVEKVRSQHGRTIGVNIRQHLAECLGISCMTLWRSSMVVNARFHPQATQEVIKAYEEMEETGNVSRAYNTIKRLDTGLIPGRVQPTITDLKGQRRLLSSACDKALALASSLPQFEKPHKRLTQDEIAQAISDLSAGRRALDRMMKTLRGAQTT